MIQVSQEIGKELSILGISVLLGAVLFFCYDILRIFRRVFPHGTLWVSIEDVIYWLGFTVAVFLMLYQTDDGMVRGFSLGGVGIGACLYYLLLSRYLVRFFNFILKKVKQYLGKLLRFLFGPTLRISRKFFRILKKQLKKIGKAVKMGLCKL
ncbi:MAG: spore cortex biosynthesis protein YabQ [Roseburia sp.]